MDIVAKWGAHTRDGGYHWATYKACCRRDGYYTGGTRGEVAFNGDLARPILELISTTWDHLFNTVCLQFIRWVLLVGFDARANTAAHIGCWRGMSQAESAMPGRFSFGAASLVLCNV